MYLLDTNLVSELRKARTGRADPGVVAFADTGVALHDPWGDPMSFPRYPAYKDSGVEWLGGVPEHWRVVPLRFLAECLD